MNPTIPQSIIDEAYESDPSSAAAEYGGNFRSDVENFLPREVIDGAIVPGRYELPPVAGVKYVGFVDPSGGSSDSFTIAAAHLEADGRVVLDAIRERRPPFSPEAVVVEYADLLNAYGCRFVVGDRYGGEWPRERFRQHGIEYQPSEKAKSEIYREFLPLATAGRVDLLDNPRLAAQLANLERRTARGGRDNVDHPPGGHDDLANAAAGAIVLAAPQARMYGGRGIFEAYRHWAAEIRAKDQPASPPAPQYARGSMEWLEQSRNKEEEVA